MTNDQATCVYVYFAADGSVLYVGITGRGVTRAHEHARSKRWWDQTRGCQIEHFDTRAEAAAREAFLIASHKPPFNTQHVELNPSNFPDQYESPATPGFVSRKAVGGSELAEVQQLRDKGQWPEVVGRWHRLPIELRQKVWCLRCDERPWINAGPFCFGCFTTYVAGRTRNRRREATAAAAT